jgi:hypothetical protein
MASRKAQFSDEMAPTLDVDSSRCDRSLSRHHNGGSCIARTRGPPAAGCCRQPTCSVSVDRTLSRASLSLVLRKNRRSVCFGAGLIMEQVDQEGAVRPGQWGRSAQIIRVERSTCVVGGRGV